jgi:hypothetical protein
MFRVRAEEVRIFVSLTLHDRKRLVSVVLQTFVLGRSFTLCPFRNFRKRLSSKPIEKQTTQSMILSVPTNVHLRKQPTDYNELLL